MNATKTFHIAGRLTPDEAVIREADIEVLTGVERIHIDIARQQATVEYDEEKISLEEIIKKVGSSEPMSVREERKSPHKSALREQSYQVEGMHCAACELIIEKGLLKIGDVKSVEASTSDGSVTIEYEGSKPPIAYLNRVFKKHGYTFAEGIASRSAERSKHETVITFGIALAVIVIFLLLMKSGLSSLISVDSKSALATFFLFGILAGLSSCAALVGGLILSMSKQWSEMYAHSDSTVKKMEPHLMFNAGRLASYALFGGILGAIGGTLQISLTWTSLLVIAVSALMIFLALQMLGVRAFQRFQLSMPKFITRRVADESRFRGRYMPIIMGALTFILPCGFTLTAQSLALLSGSFLQGSLIMFLFALGTTGPLLAIGLSSVKFSQNPRFTHRFLKVAGIVVLMFALFNINAQLNVLGAPSLNNLTIAKAAPATTSGGSDTQVGVDSLQGLVDGKQVIKMNASSNGYSPNSFKVVVGVPVRWEVTDTGTSGCTNAVISRSLFDGQIDLKPGTTSVKEFTPTKTGTFKFSCWMGMISGTIQVVERSQAAAQAPNVNTAAATNGDTAVIPSGAKGCGCGGGGGSGSCGGSASN